MAEGSGVGIIGAIFLFIFFIIMWFVWIGGFMAQIGQGAIDAGNLSGIEAFFYANLNLVVFICLLLGMMGWAYFGGAA